MPRARRAQSTRRPATPAASILGWEDDPGAPTAGRHPSARPVPKLATTPFPIRIDGKAPAAREYQPGSPGFRYWVAAEAVRRGADFWGTILPKGTKWHATNGVRLPVELDQGVDLNAFYDRHGLHFFHDTVKGVTVYSGESPDVACHELGHAVLDALRPQLWDAMAGEVAAFHESFGDMSAMLSGLQLPSLREEVLAETSSHVDRSSRLSRLAEQLGWAVRQNHPDEVDPDCLRNASNSFFYTDPVDLPPSAPASSLSSEPHSFSRVFTGAFLNILAGIFAAQTKRGSAGLLAAARDAATILVGGVQATPVVPSFYSQVAAHMLAVDAADFGGRYREALKGGFVRHGILSMQAATVPPPPKERAGAAGIFELVAPGVENEPLARIALPAMHLGLQEELLVSAASQPKRFAVGSAAADLGSSVARGHDFVAASFLEDLARRGRIDFNGHAVAGAAVLAPRALKTHEVVRERAQLVLVRRRVDCGHGCSTLVP
jgi:hypothetical protein